MFPDFAACEKITKTGNMSDTYSNSDLYGTHYPDGTVATFTCTTAETYVFKDGAVTEVSILLRSIIFGTFFS